MTIEFGLRAGMLVALSFGVIGCASRGNEVLKDQTAATINLYIVDGRTTQQEVEGLYGVPIQKSFLSAKNEVWTYRWSRATAQGQNFIPIVGPLVRGFDVRKKELVVVFDEKSIVARHTMTDINDTVKTGLIDPGPSSTGPAATTAAPIPAAGPGAAPPPAQIPTPTSTPGAGASPAQPPTPVTGIAPPASFQPGTWNCGIKNFGSTTNPFFGLQFVVGADNSITVVSYANALTTIVKADPLTFTAINPRGSRLTTFTWRADNTMTITGPNLNSLGTNFRNEGTCAKA